MGAAVLMSSPGLAQPPPDAARQAAPAGPLVGRLRIDGVAFVDDRGPVLPFYAHAGDLFSLFIRDQARALAELDAVARAGYHGVRVWSALGCSPSAPCPERDERGEPAFWRGREVGPQLTPDYYAHVGRFFAALKERRLRAVWSQGDVQVIGDRRDFMTRIARLDAEYGVIDWIDCGNEVWQRDDHPAPAALAECLGFYEAAGGRALKTLSSPPTEDVDGTRRLQPRPGRCLRRAFMAWRALVGQAASHLEPDPRRRWRRPADAEAAAGHQQ